MGRVHDNYMKYWTPAYWRSYCEGHPVRRYRGRREIQLALELLRLEGGQRVLEVGCGYGRLSEVLIAQPNVAWAGAELSPSMAEHCRQALPAHAWVVRADSSKLPFPAETFDRVLCNGVLMHVEDERKALKKLVRVTRRGGLLVVSGNNVLHPLGPLMHLRAALRRNYFQRFHLAAFYRHELERLGCRLESLRGDTLLGVGIQVAGRVNLPPAWSLPVVARVDQWGRSLLRYFGYELWFQAVKQ